MTLAISIFRSELSCRMAEVVLVVAVIVVGGAAVVVAVVVVVAVLVFFFFAPALSDVKDRQAKLSQMNL